ncbi:PIN domain-containing protein [Blastopirellula marina]|uniref:PIN domain-containing protein n=1 Tax=Blastopirellula marina TaxID=124 RepID=A0A2S8GCR8_9BACT|nr:PIN domain-containing protein [Blastopirellula marina]PQO42265.1 PIN domain-containing protein [Blastopirellula marina]
MDHPVVAVYDANILYPAPIRDLFMRLAHAGLVRAKWTEEIHDEWIRNVLKNNPAITQERLTRTRRLMNEAIRDCLVTDYEGRIPNLSLPDPNDRHVLAAAIQARASVIITFNLRDFPASILAAYDLNAIHPDTFLVDLLDADTESVCEAVSQQRRALRNPPKTADELLDTLETQGLRQSCEKLRLLVDSL